MMTIYGDGTQNLKTTFRTVMTDDASLTGYLVGGIHDASIIDDNDAGANWAPRQADGIRIAAFGIARWGNALAYPRAIKLDAENQSVAIYLHDDFDYSTIDLAAARIKALFHDSYFRCSDYSFAYATYAGIFGELKDASLANTPMEFIRFNLLTKRK